MILIDPFLAKQFYSNFVIELNVGYMSFTLRTKAKTPFIQL